MKKGFTLVEVMGVLLVLSIMFLIGTSSVTKIIKENKQKLYNEQVNSFIESAETWALGNASSLPEVGSSIKLTLKTLIDENFIKKGIKNPVTNEPFSNDEYICIFNINGNYVYKFNDEC